jgi:DNA-binding MarR family transcriptional regulator
VPDLTAAQRAALRVVAREQVSLGGLAERLDLPKSTTSVLVKRLERRGLLRRRRDSEDERRLAIVITPKGRRRVADDRVLDSTRLTAALRALPRSARAKLLDGLERVADAAERRAAVSRR